MHPEVEALLYEYSPSAPSSGLRQAIQHRYSHYCWGLDFVVQMFVDKDNLKRFLTSISKTLKFWLNAWLLISVVTFREDLHVKVRCVGPQYGDGARATQACLGPKAYLINYWESWNTRYIRKEKQRSRLQYGEKFLLAGHSFFPRMPHAMIHFWKARSVHLRQFQKLYIKNIRNWFFFYRKTKLLLIALESIFCSKRKLCLLIETFRDVSCIHQ